MAATKVKTRRRKTNAEAAHAAWLGDRLMKDIKSHFAGLTKSIYFTRDALVAELAHVPMWEEYPAISRYIMVCQGVTHLVNTGRLIQAKNRTDLVWPDKYNEYKMHRKSGPIHKHYIDLIADILRTFGGSLSLLGIVFQWDTYHAKIAPWMALDAKRVVVRLALREMEREGMISVSTDGTYQLK